MLLIFIAFCSLIDLVVLQGGFWLFADKALEWDFIQIGKYALSWGWSIAFWFVLAYVAGRSKTPLKGRLFVISAGVVFFISFGFKTEFYHLPNVNTLQFTFKEPLNSFVLIRDKIFQLQSLVVIPVFVFLYWLGSLFYQNSKKSIEAMGAKKSKKAILSAVVFLLASSGYSLGWHRFSYPLSFDTNFARIFFQQALMWTGNKSNLRHPTRLEVPKQEELPFNVVLIIHESLRADALLPGLDFTEPLDPQTNAPYFQSLIQDSLFLLLPNAYANSNTTNVSVPSLLTGLHPSASSTDFHTYPLLWDYAKKAGAHTFLVSSQDWTWEHFNDFFFSPNLEYAVHRKTHKNVELANDLGVDDAITVQSALTHLKTIDTQKSFFGVVQFNNTHPPFFAAGQSEALAPFSFERYKVSVHALDSLQGEMLTFLKNRKSEKPTLVFFTADHGDGLKSRPIGRHNNFHEELVRVPMGVWFIPGDSGVESNFKNLIAKANPRRVVQNIDLVPSILDLWGMKSTRPLEGFSIFSALEEERLISGMGTCEIRKWSPEGFFMRKGDYKMIVSEPNLPRFYDLSKDPKEMNPVEQLQGFPLEDFSEEIAKNSAIQALCKRIGQNLCTVPKM